MSPEEKKLDKIVRFEEGPIEAIGYKLETMEGQSGYKYPGQIILFTRAGTIRDSETELKLFGSQSEPNRYGIHARSGWPDGVQSHFIGLDYDIRPERQLRKIVNLLEQDGLITFQQREKAYSELGLGEDLYNRPPKEGRVF